MTTESIPRFSVRELNTAIGNLLERGFAPRFLLEATVSKPQIKKGHLWLTLTDGEASVSSVVWASKLKQLEYKPNDGDGVLIVGKLNFWTTRAALNVQVLDIKPNLSTVLRQFEIVKDLLLHEGLINETRKKALPQQPNAIGILTSVPSSALADMLKTAGERWPLTKIFVIPIPVQGNVSQQIKRKLLLLNDQYRKLNIEAIVIARGGGNREDLILFDDEQLCRTIANLPIPVITGIGHEDDLTVADLVADERAATPTAAIVKLLPSRESAKSDLRQLRTRLNENCNWIVKKERHRLEELITKLKINSPRNLVEKKRIKLNDKSNLLEAHSPQRWLNRGFSIVKNELGNSITSIEDISIPELLRIKVTDGEVKVETKSISQQGESK